MATRTQSGQSNRSSSNRSSSNGSSRSGRSSQRSAFSWGENAGPVIAAALGGAAIGFAANFGRKFITQAVSGLSGDWDEVLAAEHDLTLAVFDKMLATDSTQTWKRSMLLMQLTHMLDKHAHEEEMVVYPALRDAGQTTEADQLNSEHGYIKTFLYDLGQMGPDSPTWLDKVRQFRNLVAEHAKMEEEQVFPAFKRDLDEEQNAKITALVNKDGFWQA
ncbi:MAG TPA: hemerythrin domain-containing protein [Sphingomicrobium sp.]|nr:hemerythrin domain-containing protein [Sphingomicrobium sp.]